MKMLEVTILGVKVSAPLLNPKTAEAYEKGMNVCVRRIQKSGESEEDGAEVLREQCNAVTDYIDEVFGIGASRRILGAETDVLTCLDALADMANLYEAQVVPLIKEKTAKITEILTQAGDKGDPI